MQTAKTPCPFLPRDPQLEDEADVDEDTEDATPVVEVPLEETDETAGVDDDMAVLELTVDETPELVVLGAGADVPQPAAATPRTKANSQPARFAPLPLRMPSPPCLLRICLRPLAVSQSLAVHTAPTGPKCGSVRTDTVAGLPCRPHGHGGGKRSPARMVKPVRTVVHRVLGCAVDTGACP